MARLYVYLFSANTASTVAGLVWFLQFFPFLFMQQNYDTLSLSTKLFASLGSNSAMGFGFQIMLMYEGTGEGKFNSKFFDVHFLLETIYVNLNLTTLVDFQALEFCQRKNSIFT